MNLNVKTTAKNFFDKFFWRQHPEAALRYAPVVEEIKRLKLADSKILEVGSGSLGITPYLKRQVDGVDVDFTGPQSEFINKIKGSATQLPQRKNSYDVVISVDTLEHIEKKDREKAIFEMLRVAKKLAIIVVPTGKLSENQDKAFNDHWKNIFKDENQFLKEHVQNGLPTTEEILMTLDKSKRTLVKNAKIKSYPNLNLKVRSILMRTWITKNHLMYYLYLKGYLLLLPLLKLANFGNCYRRIFVIEFTS